MTHTRRSLLASLSVALVAGAGCVGGQNDDGTDGDPGGTEGDGTPDPDDSDNTDEKTDEKTDEDGDEKTDEDGEPPAESSYTLAVEQVDESTVLERLDVAVLAEQSAGIREAVEAAMADRYETDAVDPALAAFVAEHGFVRADGEYYALETKFPVEVLSASPVDREGIDGSEIAGPREFRRDEVVTDAVTAAVADGEATRASFPEMLPDLVEEYEYVTLDDPDDETEQVYEWRLGTDDRGGPPYWIEATAVDSAEVFGEDVAGIESLSAAAREEVQTAREGGPQTFDDAPTVLDERSFQFLRIEGSFYRVVVSVGN